MIVTIVLPSSRQKAGRTLSSTECVKSYKKREKDTKKGVLKRIRCDSPSAYFHPRRAIDGGFWYSGHTMVETAFFSGNILIIAIPVAFISFIGLLLWFYAEIQRERRETAKEMEKLQKKHVETLSYTTHQIRSPLTAVKGFASLLLDNGYGELTEEVRHAVDKILRSSEHLVMLVEEYREYIDFETGKIVLNREETNITDFISGIIEELAFKAKEKKIKIVSKYQSNLPEICIDQRRFKQVLYNIIENAIAYTPDESEIRVTTRSDGKNLLITISDDGPGIPEDEIMDVFDKFRRGRVGTLAGKGSGLGLYIAKTIVESHGGNIRAIKCPTRGGASFQIEVPVRA